MYMKAYLCFIFDKTLVFLTNKSLLFCQALLAFPLIEIVELP